jgi:hypothetical protein
MWWRVVRIEVLFPYATENRMTEEEGLAYGAYDSKSIQL